MPLKNNVNIRSLLVGLLYALFTQDSLAAQDDDLKKVETGTALAGRLAAVGQVFSGSGSTLSMASGFLVSPCHVLTAGHVLAKVGEHVQIGSDVRFVLSNAYARLSAPVTGMVVAASQNFTMQANPEGFDQQRIPNDWALIELVHTISDVEPIKLLYQGASNSAEIVFTVAGYPIGQRRQGIYAQERCAKWSSLHGGIDLKNILIADCAVRAGDGRADALDAVQFGSVGFVHVDGGKSGECVQHGHDGQNFLQHGVSWGMKNPAEVPGSGL